MTGVAPVTESIYDVQFAPQNAVGAYRLTIGADMQDPKGNLFDQDGDGVGGENPDDHFVADFTTLAESTTPKEVVRIINGYFSEMADAIGQNHGLVLQFIGDEIEAIILEIDLERINSTDFEILGHRLEFLGVCPICLDKSSRDANRES